MKYGVKADNLIYLRERYPDNVPAFEIIPFEDVIDNYKPLQRRINKLVSDILLKSENTNSLKVKLRKISNSIKVDRRSLSTYDRLIAEHQWEKVSMRTSAYSEDGKGLSFAGQYVSFVDIPYSLKFLETYVVSCYRSLFSERVIEYARARGAKALDIGGSLVVQNMFYGTRSGVMFTENGKGEIEFAVAYSWRNTIVEGDSATRLFVPKLGLRGHGITDQLRSIAKIGIELERQYGSPVDVEWSYHSGKVMILQVRPQTTGTTNYALTWDGTNISENYPGITLPLTYSFIRGLYAQVYPSFFRLMGMSEAELKKNDWIFNNALGYINGRVYYRIENWYELVNLIPGLRNQNYFEAMLKPVKKKGPAKKSIDYRILLKPSVSLLALRFSWLLLRSGAYSKSFAGEFSVKFDQYQHMNWASMSAEAVLSHLIDIRREMLVMWGIPILNDMRVMISHGIFKTILLKGASTETYLSHLSGLTDRASIKPLQALSVLGNDIDIAMKAEGVSHIDMIVGTRSWAAIEAKATTFITSYGGRTPDELKLENPRLGENISDVLQLAYSSKDADLSLVATVVRPSLDSLPFAKRIIIPLVSKHVREAIDYRERFRFNRAQIFGLARTAYLSLGARLAEANVIDSVDDVFYLTEDEIHAVINGHSWVYDFREIIASRKKQYNAYNQMPFWLRVSGTGSIAATSLQDTSSSGKHTSQLEGEGVAPGRVTREVIVVEDFDPKLDVSNKILVVRHVDPGWTLLLVQAAGVITERGNALSHVAIVSREICVPAIVGVKDVVNKLQSGEIVTMDGTSGEIIRES